MAFIRVNNQDEEGLEKALRLFKKQCIREGIVEELKRRKNYIPDSVKKQLKKKEAIARKMRAERKNKKLY